MPRLLGLDPGAVRCGVAVTNSVASMAFPRTALKNDASFLALLAALVDEEGVATIVVGRPIALSGKETSSTLHADALFGAIVDAFPDLDVVQWDERLTTFEAQRSLRQAGVRAKDQRDHLDSAAAVIMLQSYVDGLHVD
jgi:putative Holliday junction resolvase